MKFEYLLILLLLALVSFLIQKILKIKLFQNKKQLIIFYLIDLAVGVAWDQFAVWRGHWFYPGKGILGIFIGFIPLEDFLFIIICSYFGLTIYQAIKKLS